jgi:hypothetical protein
VKNLKTQGIRTYSAILRVEWVVAIKTSIDQSKLSGIGVLSPNKLAVNSGSAEVGQNGQYPITQRDSNVRGSPGMGFKIRHQRDN